MISRFHAGAHWRAWTTAGGFVAVLISLGTPVFAQSVKETRVSFPSANAQQNGYEHAALDIIYRATSCGGGIHVGYAVEPGSLDVTNGYWYEGHRYAIEAGWPQPRSQSFAIQMNAKHGARTIREWEKRDPITTDKVGCDNAVEFFYVAGGWEALLGDQAGDRAFELLRRPEVDYAALLELTGAPPDAQDLDARIAEQRELELVVRARYAGYIERQHIEIERTREHESAPLPTDLDYAAVNGLSNEVRQRLAEVRPVTLGQAARVPGVTPAAVSLLMIHMKRRRALAS